MNRKLKTSELNRPTQQAYRALEKLPVVVVLDNIRSLSNVGSVFRTSDAFLVEHVTLCGITGRPPHREIQRTALGATESVEWSYKESTLEAVQEWKEKGYHVVCIEQTSGAKNPSSLSDFDKLCLVLGNEVDGVDQHVIEASDACVEIPQSGTKHSLNVSVAAGVVLWEVYRERKARASET